MKRSTFKKWSYRAALLGVSLGFGIVLFSSYYGFSSTNSRADEIVYATTNDGWNLALHHYPAQGERRGTYPVVVCHGIMSNRHNWDLLGERSFPEYISRQGYDTWLIELRGSGESDKPGWFGERKADYTFDDYVLRDVPAFLRYVTDVTGAPQVHWVGHSMGGMIIYAYLQRGDQELMRSVIAVGSPPLIGDGNELVNLSLPLVPVAERIYDELPSGLFTKATGALAFPALLPQMHLFWNYDNMNVEVARMAATHAVDNIPTSVLEQLTKGSEKGHLKSADGSYDYTLGLHKILVPFFLVAGASDQLAPPGILMGAYDRIGSARKRIEVLSEANGYEHDYGHVDLVLGESAPREVFPLLKEWIVEHD